MRSNGVVGTVLTLVEGGDDSLCDDRHVFFVLERPRLSFIGEPGYARMNQDGFEKLRVRAKIRRWRQE